ncbi:hypothetical protein KIN20_024927 [Parelaphostrongylus tenuis]|uniref:Uncharacterized protein n=1 Tax=Parelaphostrongylus tenuis TaxID=148309 RepID=A0AAD5MUA6_PARTN|nr:hypothetical protein KIN20_024927 [Parelaphostrongylus tenuis]
MHHSGDVLEKGNVIVQLHHRKIRNRVMPVAVDFDRQIGEPRLIPGKGWAVPCDVVGLGSKKAKLVKVRFHPSVAKLECSDSSIASTAIADAMKYLDALLEHSEWTRNEVKSVDPCLFHLDRIAQFLALQRPVLSLTSQSLDLSWSLHYGGVQSKCESSEKIISDARCSLRIRSIAAGIVAKVQQMNGCDGQEVEVMFEKAEFVRPLLRMFLPEDRSYLQSGTIEGCWEVMDNSNSLHLSLPRAHVESETLPVGVPAAVKVFVLNDGKEIPLMMEACQLRVEELRRRLDGSLAAFQRSSSNENAKQRALHIVRQNSTETLVEINSPGALARFDRLLAASPLKVICGGNGGDGNTDVAASPADSTDSGVVLSPPSSPYSSDSQQSPFYQYSEQACSKMRQRSASDCVGLNGFVLKSILKKPHRSDRLSKSISESHNCHTDFRTSVAFSRIDDGTRRKVTTPLIMRAQWPDNGRSGFRLARRCKSVVSEVHSAFLPQLRKTKGKGLVKRGRKSDSVVLVGALMIIPRLRKFQMVTGMTRKESQVFVHNARIVVLLMVMKMIVKMMLRSRHFPQMEVM